MIIWLSFDSTEILGVDSKDNKAAVGNNRRILIVSYYVCKPCAGYLL